MTQSLTATNVWLAIIALVSLAEFLIVLTVAFIGYRLYKRATELIDRAEVTYVAPLAAKVNGVVGEVQDVVRRVQRLEERARAMVARVEDTAGRAASVAQHAWPVLGTWRAVSAAVSALRGNHHHHHTEAEHLGAAPSGRSVGSAGRGPWPMP